MEAVPGSAAAACNAVARTESTQSEDRGTLGNQYEDIQKQGIIFAGICKSNTSDCKCRDEGKCELSDILQVLINISVLILGLSGSVLLMMVFYGGFLWITAGGSPDRINKGKQVLVGSVIGIFIIFGAYTAVTFLVNVLRTGNVPSSSTTIENSIEGGSSIIKTQTN